MTDAEEWWNGLSPKQKNKVWVAMARRNERLIAFWKEKLEGAELALKAREQAAETWRGGNSRDWAKAGCAYGKKERMKIAAREQRIAEKCKDRIELIKETIEKLVAVINSEETK